MAVFVLDRHKQPLMPCSEKRARLMLQRGRARVHRLYPFTIRLVDRTQQNCAFQPIRLKLDPGSKTSGIALVRESEGTGHVLQLAELDHRGRQISEALGARRAFRRRRRSANLRYRAPRFDNRRRSEGWLAPSLQHRVDSTMAWVCRFQRLSPVSAITMELVRFDTQALQNPEISGIEYQQGTLAGYELREYLLEKWGRQCAYCGAKNVPLNLDHIHPRSRDGSNRVSNLALACIPCNQRKGNQDIRDFLKDEPERLQRILAHAKAPLKGAAAVNATRWALFRTLRSTGLPVSVGSGGQTKWNRHRLGIPKTHALDAACAGKVEFLLDWQQPTITIEATGRGSYQRTRLTRHGFPRGYCTRVKRIQGFATGDIVRATLPTGRYSGTHVGRVAVRARGSFNLRTRDTLLTDIHVRHFRLLQRNNGYNYKLVATCGSPA
jgi:5-methylcytosine-specific restriction endonuclease McrA